MVTTMKTTQARILSIGLLASLLLAAMAIFVPTAAAQAGSIQITCAIPTSDAKAVSEKRLLPETDALTFPVSCDVTLSAGGTCIVPVTVEWTPGPKPNYATISFNPSAKTETFDPPTPPATQVKKVISTSVTITVNRQAPAFQDGSYQINAKAKGSPSTQGGCSVVEATASPVSFTVKPGYLPLTQISPSLLFAKAGQNKKVGFPVEIQNLGNGPTLVSLGYTQPGKNKLDSINPGAELRLKSIPTDGASSPWKATRTIEVLTPHSNGYTNSIYTFLVTFKSEFDGTGTDLATKETTVSFSVQVQGVYVPGFDPSLALLGLGIALSGIAVARRKSE